MVHQVRDASAAKDEGELERPSFKLVRFSWVRGHGKVAGAGLIRRTDSPTAACTRFSHQTAFLNGTLYLYGGQVKATGTQSTDTWKNNLLALDLTNGWDVGHPLLSGLPQPDGPPAVANGYIWNDYDNLFLYGGEFADNPYVEPAAVSIWKYAVASGAWTEYLAPLTSSGNNSDGGGQPVQRSAEGAGISVPELGRSWYFGGHLDLATTPGWSDQVARVYLKSLLEFTHPGYINDGVYSLGTSKGAPESGVYRNITQGGLQGEEVFTERADGALVFIPGWGDLGVLIGLAGGTATEFTDDLSTLDVYDIASSVWYHQKTTGNAPSVRVNPCAVVAAAPDASSFQIFLFGGQNLQPFKQQTQYSDMYILTIPSFTWVGPIMQDGSDMPSPRAGHTCNLRDGQMIVVGGYIGQTTDCDSSPAYVFNASSLKWTSSFKPLSPEADLNSENSVLAASYGYMVPEEVVRVIGGSPGGGATASTPAAGPATNGPFATGKSPVFTVTASGTTATITASGSSEAVPAPSPSANIGRSHHSSEALTAAGVVAGCAGVAAAYLGYCAWLYRRQVRAYKSHLAVVNRYNSPVTASRGSLGGFAAIFGRRAKNKSHIGSHVSPNPQGRGEKHGWGHSRHESASSGSEPLAWAGRDSMNSPTMGTSRESTVGERHAPVVVGIGGHQDDVRDRPRNSESGGSTSSAERLLDGQELSFFNVVMGPRRALRVVNGLQEAELN